nr:hypothetical protein [uncultured Cohaesibacter sp.]
MQRAEGTDGQQNRRKKRRSRSRKKRDNGPASTGGQVRRDEPSHQNQPHETAADRSVHGEDVSVSDTGRANTGHADRRPAKATGIPASEATDSALQQEREQSEHGQQNGNQGRKSSRRRKRGGRRAEARESNPVAATASAGGDGAHQAGKASAKGKGGSGSAQGVAKDNQSQTSAQSPSNAQSRQPNSRSSQPRQTHSGHGQAQIQGQGAAQTPQGHGYSSYAALDLGTNNCRLLVAEPYGQSFRVVDAFSRIVRLGEGLSQSGRLSEEAQERAIAALKVCQSKLSYRSVKRFRLIATEACRRAANGPAFLNRVHRETGLRLEIVDRETEARLAVAGCASLVHPEADGVVLFDIGGGSSEIVWLDLDPLSEEGAVHPGEKRNRQTRRAMRHLSERIRCWASLQVGVVTLSEKHGGKVVTREHFETMVEEVRGMLGDFAERDALAKAIKTKHIHMLGTSGTVTTLAGVHLGLERYDRRQVDGTWLTATELRDMIGRVLDMNFQERMNNPCIGADRADLVLAGCAILEAFHREWPCSQLRVADRGLREGILMEMMIDDGVWNPQVNQSGKKAAGKKKRSRRRGSRGHRGGHGRSKVT